MPKYYIYPFATAGDKTAVPDGVQVDGSMSYNQGFTPDYELNQGTDPDAKAVPRNQTNELFYDATSNIQYWQQNNFPAFISTSDNGGSAFPYKTGVIVQYPSGTGNPLYRSLIDTNTNLPSVTTAWGLYDNVSGKLTLDNSTFEGTVVDANVVYYNSGASNYQKAQANNSAAQFAVGIADVTHGRLIMNGQCAVVTGLTPGSVYYLSSGTPGAITTTITAVRIGVAITSTLLLLNIVYNPSFEIISSIVVAASAVSIPTSATAVNITSLSVTAGLWNIYANVSFLNPPDTNLSAIYGWTSTTSATIPDESELTWQGITTGAFVGTNSGLVVPFRQVSASGSTTVYLSAGANFTAGATVTACGKLYAQRVG